MIQCEFDEHALRDVFHTARHAADINRFDGALLLGQTLLINNGLHHSLHRGCELGNETHCGVVCAYTAMRMRCETRGYAKA